MYRANYSSSQLDCQSVRPVQPLNSHIYLLARHSIIAIRANYFHLLYLSDQEKRMIGHAANMFGHLSWYWLLQFVLQIDANGMGRRCGL